MKISVFRNGQVSVGSRPERAHTSARTSPAGWVDGVSGLAVSAARMNSCQIGPAPDTPVTFTIGALSALPTHTPTARSGVYPTVQLSRKSVVVPVLAAA